MVHMSEFERIVLDLRLAIPLLLLVPTYVPCLYVHVRYGEHEALLSLAGHGFSFYSGSSYTTSVLST